MSIEPLSILLKSIDNKPATLLRNRNGKTIARVYDDEYTPLFLAALLLRDTLRWVVESKHRIPDDIWLTAEKSLSKYDELVNIHVPVKGSVA